MEIRTPAASPTKRANPEYFTGTVWQDPIMEAPVPATLRVVRVSFEPGARTFWHTHPVGQTLHILAGVGRVQSWGQPVREVRAGDTVWFSPGEKHWHGAAPSHGMVHLAMQESVNGSSVSWLEPVSEPDYGAAPAL